MSDEPPFNADAEPATDSKVAIVEPAKLVIPRKMNRKKFIRTITLKEQAGAGFRETQIPATLRDARLQQVILVSKLQQTQERALNTILDDPTRVLSHGEMSGLNNAIDQSNKMMIKIFAGEAAPGGQSEGEQGAATLGAALGAGISAGLSVIAAGDPDLATALIAVTKSAKGAKKPEPINVTPTK